MVTFLNSVEVTLKTENPERVEKLKELARKVRALLEGEFTLSSGAKSPYYFDGKMVSLWPEGAYLIGQIILEEIADLEVDAIGGLTIGADPIATAVALVSHIEGRPIPAFIVRTEPKKHGTQQFIEGHLPKNGRVVIVDDVVTKGTSVLKAIDAVEKEGCKVVRVIALLDRNEGGGDELRRRKYDFITMMSYDPSGKVVVEQ